MATRGAFRGDADGRPAHGRPDRRRLAAHGRRGLAPAERDPSRLHDRGQGNRAPRRGADRARQRTRLAAPDPRRAAVHGPHPRPRRPGPERRDRPRGLADRAGDARRGPRHRDRGRDRHHRRQHARDRAARDRRRRLLLPQRAQARGPARWRRGLRRCPAIYFLEIDGLAHACSSARFATATCPRSRAGSARVAPAAALGDRLVLADRRLPGGPAARLERRHARVPLVGEGARAGDRHQPPEGRRRDRAPPLGRARPPARGRRQPRQHPLRRRAPHAADDEHRARPRPAGPPGPGLLRVLLEPVQRHPHAGAGDRRHRPGALLRRTAAPPRHPPADQALVLLRARSRLGHGDPARPPGRRGDRRPLRRAPGRLHDLPRLRRGRAPLGRGARRRPGRPAPAGPPDRAHRRRRRGRRPGRTTSSSSPTTGSHRARRSSTATGRRSRRSSPKRAPARRSRRRTPTATRPSPTSAPR